MRLSLRVTTWLVRVIWLVCLGALLYIPVYWIVMAQPGGPSLQLSDEVMITQSGDAQVYMTLFDNSPLPATAVRKTLVLESVSYTFEQEGDGGSTVAAEIEVISETRWRVVYRFIANVPIGARNVECKIVTRWSGLECSFHNVVRKSYRASPVDVPEEKSCTSKERT